MYKTSEKYYNAIYINPVVKRTISGAIMVDSNTTIALSDKDIITGSLQIDNKCVNDDGFEYGAVFQGELNVTLMLSINRYQLYGKKISFTVHQQLADGTTEDIPLGSYTITDPQWSRKLLTIKAVDGMEQFDVEISESFFGTLFELLQVACKNCGVEMAQTAEQLKLLTNGDVQYSCYNTQITTYRDLLAYLAKCTCTFATINRSGKLELRPYGTVITREIPISRRKDTVIADYETYYQGVKARFLAEQNYAPYEHIEAGEAGLVLNLGDIPVVYGLPETKQGVIDNIWLTLSKVRYTPTNFNLLISDPSLELGDMIKVNGKIATEDVVTYITAYTWVYHGNMSIKGVGANPKLVKLKNKNQVDISDLTQQIAEKDIVVYTYTNATNYTISGEANEVIIRILYTTIGDTVPIFMSTIPVIMNADGYFKLKYRKNDVDLANSEIIKYLAKGKHFVTCLYYMKDKADKFNKFEVVASTEYFESAVRVNTADITALKTYANSGTLPASVIDTTIPTATIEQLGIKAVLFGQGLAAAESEWDGRISITETVPKYGINVGIKLLKDSVNVSQQIPNTNTLVEVLPKYSVTVPIKSFTVALGSQHVVKSYTANITKADKYAYDNKYVNVIDGFSINNDYVNISNAVTIDNGSMCSLAVDLTPFETVESVVVKG